MIDSKLIVEEGYDSIAGRFAAWRAAVQGSPDDAWLDDLLARLPAGAAVLELGCGQGEAARRIVDSGHRYVGVDISAEQLGRARTLQSAPVDCVRLKFLSVVIDPPFAVAALSGRIGSRDQR